MKPHMQVAKQALRCSDREVLAKEDFGCPRAFGLSQMSKLDILPNAAPGLTTWSSTPQVTSQRQPGLVTMPWTA